MKKQILIPIDFSDNAWNALNYAIHLYKHEPCEFYILNAFQAYGFPSGTLLPPDDGEPRYEAAKNASEQGLQKVLDRIHSREENPLHHFRSISFYDHLRGAVNEAVEVLKIDLIILGTQGQTNAAGRAYGNSALDILENIETCPIMAIPQNVSVFIKGQKKEIVLSTNFRTPCKATDLDFLVETAKLFEAELKVLYIKGNRELNREQQKNKRLMEELLKDVNFSYSTLTRVDLATGIHSYLESRGSDMLALVHKKSNLFTSIFKVPLVQQMNRKQQVPLLVMHGDEAPLLSIKTRRRILKIGKRGLRPATV